jgi:hypothetical protein
VERAHLVKVAPAVLVDHYQEHLELVAVEEQLRSVEMEVAQLVELAAQVQILIQHGLVQQVLAHQVITLVAVAVALIQAQAQAVLEAEELDLI